MNGTQRAAVRPGESAVVFGAGAIGCLFTAVLAASGAKPVIVVEPRPERAPVALALGATAVVTPDELVARRDELLPFGADVVVDAVGSVLARCIDIAAQSGRLVIFGMNSNARPPIHQVEITEKGLTIFGSYITDFTFPPAIRFVESNLVDLSPMISAVMTLDQTPDGIALLRGGTATKVVIKP
jgi:threonine dehydrogenase-like Zn-dependent dehydrogenase